MDKAVDLKYKGPWFNLRQILVTKECFEIIRQVKFEENSNSRFSRLWGIISMHFNIQDVLLRLS